jgi:hypothetical protein
MMDNALWFDKESSYNPQFLQFADIDGLRTSDLLYINPKGVDIYLNNAGNGFSSRKRLSNIPLVDRFSTVETVDLFRNGSTCIVWSSKLPRYSQLLMKYINFTQGKLHLLISQVNNLGGEIHIHYALSTKFYLDDKQVGRKWITTLLFPIQYVEKVETFEHISGNRFMSRYAYHHGFFDGYKREFCGFAMVNEWDTEEFNAFSTLATNFDSRWHSSLVHSKSWFSTGNFLSASSSELTLEYFEIPESHEATDGFSTTLLEDSIIPSSLNLTTIREACRALKGHLLRHEVYLEDNSLKAEISYTVVESSNYTVWIL